MAETRGPFQRTPDARYQTDSMFRHLVDMLESQIHAAQFTPTELREAALLAAIHHANRSIKNLAGYTMTPEKARECWATVEELYREIQTDSTHPNTARE